MTFIGSLSGSTGSSSSSAASLLQNTSTITGLASGMNTDAMVQSMVEAAQTPLISELQQRQVLQWKQEEYQQANTALTNLQNSLSNMKLQSTFLTQQASSSNSSILTATANGLAANGTYSVSVSQLAQGTILDSSPTYDANTPLAQLPGNPLGVSSTDTSESITINGQQISYNPQTDTINSVLNDINTNIATGVSAFYDANSGKVVMQTTATGSSANINVTGDTAGLFQGVLGFGSASAHFSGSTTTNAGTVTINGQSITVTAGESLSSVASNINSLTGAGVTAKVTTDASGNSTLIVMTSDVNQTTPPIISDPSNALNLTSDSVQAQAGQDAQYTVNGIATSSSTNTATFGGVTYNLGGLTGSNPVSVTVSSNTSAVVQSITNFVQTYNQTLQTLQGLYNTPRNSSYQPLTSAQASQMTQTQIDEWNQKAQAGLLEFDPMVGSAMTNMKNIASSILTGLTSASGQSVPQSLSDLGITPINPMNGVSSGATAPGVTTTGWNTYGLLQINTTQLTAAIQANPQGVMNLFTNNPPPITTTNPDGSTTTTPDTTKQGLAQQLFSAVSGAATLIKQQAGLNNTPLPTTPNANTGQILLPSTAVDPNGNLSPLFGSDAFDTSFIGQQISSIDTRAQQLQQLISSEQTRWQSQFTKMEQAIQTLNSQQSQLIGMLG